MSTVDATVATPSLKYWRYANALTQAELAQLGGTSESTIVRLEHGGRTHAAVAQQLNAALVQYMLDYARDIGALPTRTHCVDVTVVR